MQFTTLTADFTFNTVMMTGKRTWTNKDNAASSWVESNNTADAKGKTIVIGNILFEYKPLAYAYCPLCLFLDGNVYVNRKSKAIPN